MARGNLPHLPPIELVVAELLSPVTHRQHIILVLSAGRERGRKRDVCGGGGYGCVWVGVFLIHKSEGVGNFGAIYLVGNRL